MATDTAHSYVHTPSIGDKAACQKYHHTISKLLQALSDKSGIKGFQAIIIENATIEEEELIPADDVAAITGEEYPYVFIRIQPNDDDQINVDGLMENYEAISLS